MTLSISKPWALPLAALVSLALTACGGGGGDSPASAQPLPKLADTASLSYSEPDHNSYMHDPWTRVRMVPKLSGLPAGATVTYSAKAALAKGRLSRHYPQVCQFKTLRHRL